MGVITYNGVASSDVGIVVETYPDYQYAEKEFETINVPGRNGTVYRWNGNYKNVTQQYKIAFGAQPGDTFPALVPAVSDWLHSADDYVRLSDTYTPDYYRLAIYKESNTLKNLLNGAGRATIKFDCKPQRFLVSGDTPITLSANGTITNPTNQPSKPIITVYGTGNGTLNIGSYTVGLTGIQSYITINCEVEEAYKDAEFQNGKVTTPNGYPVLVPGANGVEFSGGITSVEIVPRWWRL